MSRHFVTWCVLVLIAPVVWLVNPRTLPAKEPAGGPFNGPRLLAAPAEETTEDAHAQEGESAEPETDLAELTEMERMTLLEDGLKSDTERLVELRKDLQSREDDYQEARQEFNEITTELEKSKKQLPKLTGTPAAQLKEQIAALEKRIALAKQRFDLAIEERRNVQTLITTLEEQLEQSQEALEELKGAPRQDDDEDDRHEKHDKHDKQEGRTNSKNQDDEDDKKSGDDDEDDDEVTSKELEEAQEEVKDAESEVKQADQDIARAAERRRTLQKSIELEMELLRTARQRGDNLELTIQNLEQDFGRRLSAGAPRDELAELRKDIQNAQRDLHDVRGEVRNRTDRMENLNAQLAAVQTEELQLAHEAEIKRHEADAAHRKAAFVEFQQNVIERAPKFLLVLAFMFILWRLQIIFGRRLARLIAHSGRGTQEERQNRADTLVGVLDNAMSVVIVIGGCLTLMDVIGVPIVPLMGGAAVVGLAAAFGAQNLIRDYFYGFIILLENQYKLNDVVTINDMSGTVERITLRITVLRDFEGRVYYIPNGQITSVINSTHGWGRSILEVHIGYEENVDNAISLMMSLAEELRHEPQYSAAIMEGPEMLGVERLAEEGVLVKISLKTVPDKKMAVKRELLRRVKNAFDEQGIELAAASRTIHIRNDAVTPLGSSKAA